MWLRASLPHLEAAPLIAVLHAHVESDRHDERDRLTATRATRPSPRTVGEQVEEWQVEGQIARRVILDHD